jgi:hypothetical protein
MSAGDVALLVLAGAFAVFGLAWLVRMALFLHRRREDAPRALWFLVVERSVAWIVVGLALAFGALGSTAVGHWLFLGALVLVVVESFVWRALLPKLAADFDQVMR